ncbi:MAG: hypothetical protein JNM42_03960 [Propionivibrio sp.]|uniref:hypothetical protein n=1 Tax=Propionivibrio sp. TaxID=2212460 RepID=UPI001A443911|nr:hypothetical protein [Propionivibrio sp.]MBL8413575.1 hypothetical protein [Propionivibrio sp.]
MLNMILVSLGVLLAFSFVGALAYFYVQDVTQEKHAVLRNFPLVGYPQSYTGMTGDCRYDLPWD